VVVEAGGAEAKECCSDGCFVEMRVWRCADDGRMLVAAAAAAAVVEEEAVAEEEELPIHLALVQLVALDEDHDSSQKKND